MAMLQSVEVKITASAKRVCGNLGGHVLNHSTSIWVGTGRLKVQACPLVIGRDRESRRRAMQKRACTRSRDLHNLRGAIFWRCDVAKKAATRKTNKTKKTVSK